MHSRTRLSQTRAEAQRRPTMSKMENVSLECAGASLRLPVCLRGHGQHPRLTNKLSSASHRVTRNASITETPEPPTPHTVTALVHCTDRLDVDPAQKPARTWVRTAFLPPGCADVHLHTANEAPVKFAECGARVKLVVDGLMRNQVYTHSKTQEWLEQLTDAILGDLRPSFGASNKLIVNALVLQTSADQEGGAFKTYSSCLWDDAKVCCCGLLAGYLFTSGPRTI